MSPPGPQSPLDVLIVGRTWKVRALLRAQLIEEGFEVRAVDEWESAAGLLLSLGLPRATLLILDDVPDPAGLLRDAAAHLAPQRALVLTAAATLAAEDVRRLGFTHVLARPYTIGEVVARVRRIMAGPRDGQE